jgi:DNA-binding HxlR family transcriptional regulator
MEDRNPEVCRRGVEASLDIIVGKWKPVILLHLINGGTMRFGELKKRLPEITQKMLTAQLRELEEQDIIMRRVYPVVPPKVEYSITEYGMSLHPILQAMHDWGVVHLERMAKKNADAPRKDIS